MATEQITEVLSTHTPDLFSAAVERAASLLRQGQLVALPTETVYGLAANAFDPEAVARLFAVKGRPRRNPVIVHVADTDMARRCTADWPAFAEQLARAFWPGPLTLVLPRHPAVPDAVTAAGPTVGVRWPSHPFTQAVIRACGFPLAAPSANLSEQTSPTTAAHALRSLQGRIPLLIDGGSCQVGIESTVVDLTHCPPQILRPGMVHSEALVALLGELDSPATHPHSPHLRSPGSLLRHYAPRAPLRIARWENDADLHSTLASLPSARRICVVAHTHIPSPNQLHRVSVVPHDPEAFARALYAELHSCDEAAADLIVVEAVPDSPLWHGIADRLRRAAS